MCIWKFVQDITYIKVSLYVHFGRRDTVIYPLVSRCITTINSEWHFRERTKATLINLIKKKKKIITNVFKNPLIRVPENLHRISKFRKRKRKCKEVLQIVSPAATSPVLRVHLGVRRAGHGAEAAGCRTRRAGRKWGLLVDGRSVRRRWTLNPGVVVIVMQVVQLQPSVVRMEQAGASRLLRRGGWTGACRAARRGRCLFFFFFSKENEHIMQIISRLNFFKLRINTWN